MPAATYSIEFDGYWLDEKKGSIPNESGVYCVYVCSQYEQGGFIIDDLIYIGESDEVRDRISYHENQKNWKKHLKKPEQTLCYNFAPVSPQSKRERVEAALINYHKPVENIEYKDSFPFDTTTIKVEGDRAKFLDKKFTVYRH